MKKGLFFLIILAAVSCIGDKAADGIMNKEAMVSYLVDLHLAEAGVSNLRLPPDTSEYIFKAFEVELLEKHNISDSTFLLSYNYYLEHPDQLQEIYTAVVDSISLKQSLER